MAKILLSPIGRSPGAVTGIYYALQEQTPAVNMDMVILVATTMEYVQQAVNIVRKTLGPERVRVLYLRVPGQDSHDFKDKATVLDFIHQINAVLDHARRAKDEVYIGISGGRSSMGALATLSAYIYGATGVYHLWVHEDIERRGDVQILNGLLPTERKSILQPQPDKYQLVTLPLATFDQFWTTSWLSETLAERPEVREALLRAVTDAELQELEKLRQKREASFEEIAKRLHEIFKGTEIQELVDLSIKVSGGDETPLTWEVESKPYIKPSLREQIKRELHDLETYKKAADRLLTFVETIATPLTIGTLAFKHGIPLP